MRYYAGNLNTAKGFLGQYNDGSGLDYFNARYYDPVVGVFLSADSKQGNMQGMNPYAYVDGNPETKSDPTGHVPAPPEGGGGSYVSALDEWYIEQAVAVREVMLSGFKSSNQTSADLARGVLKQGIEDAYNNNRYLNGLDFNGRIDVWDLLKRRELKNLRCRDIPEVADELRNDFAIGVSFCCKFGK